MAEAVQNDAACMQQFLNDMKSAVAAADAGNEKPSEASSQPVPKRPSPPTNPAPSKKSWAVNKPVLQPWGTYYQPCVEDVNVRSKDYLQTSIKQPNGMAPLLELVHMDFFHAPQRVDHIAGNSASWLRSPSFPKELADRQFFVINVQVATMGITFVQYFVLNSSGTTGENNVDEMYKRFVSGTDDYRNHRLKIIPIMTAGPWLARKTVPQRPCIIGTKVTHRYFKGDNYFETDIETDSSTIAKGVLKVLQGYNNYSCSMIWILEGKTAEELPERVLCAANIGNPDYTKAHHLGCAASAGPGGPPGGKVEEID